MRCPFCGSLENRVIDSRMARDGRAIRRRRMCGECSERFTTYEVVEEAMAEVIKKDESSEIFDRKKLLKSMGLALQKRPFDMDALTTFVDRLEAQVAAMPRRTINTRELGEHVLGFLHKLDAVAYVRYASVYREFTSVDEFTAELSNLQEDPDSGADPA